MAQDGRQRGAVVGLNGAPDTGTRQGMPFIANRCLAQQVAWVKANAKPSQAYTIAAYPSAGQLLTHRADGPWSPTTKAGQLSNVGYAEATYAADSLGAAGFAPPVVWIDVEPRAAQPWPTATAEQRMENRYVLEGLMRGLRDHGLAYGLYSFASGWESITGSWRVPGVPVWATAGRLDYPGEALDRCTQPSFSGGRVLLSQWYDDERDYDRTCEPYAFTPLAVPASTLSGATADFNGDWDNDVLARVAPTGDLRLYAGTGRGALTAGVRIGGGWKGMSALETPGDVDGDGLLDVLAREASTGSLWLYPGNGAGGWLPRVRIGTGWNSMTAVASAGDLNGDRTPDLLARDRSGVLWLYPRNATGSWLPRARVGGGWNSINAIF